MSEYIDKNEAVDEGYLADWYIHSVAEYADEKRNEPRWTEKHIEELTQDFIVIPKDTPVADVAPVVHAYWKRVDKGDGGHDTVCSHCSTPIVTYLETPYCHNCGAKMDGGGDEKNEKNH